MGLYNILLSQNDEWKAHGRCYTEKIDPRIFDGVQTRKFGPIDFSEAKAICASCPVRGFCLEDAIQNDETECVRGGLEPKEYQQLKANPDRKVPLKKPGTKRARQKLVAA